MPCLSWFDNVNISDIATITITNVDYHCIIHNSSKSKAINLLKNYVLEDKIFVLVYVKKYCLKFQSTHNSFFNFFCFAVYKMVDRECSMDI